MAKWRQVAPGTKKVALALGPRNGGPAPLSWPPTPLGHGLAPPPGLGWGGESQSDFASPFYAVFCLPKSQRH
jgi:hypothetical protein